MGRARSFGEMFRRDAVQRQVFATREAAQRALFGFIQVFYNRQQLHSGLDYVRPAHVAALVTTTLINRGEINFAGFEMLESQHIALSWSRRAIDWTDQSQKCLDGFSAAACEAF